MSQRGAAGPGGGSQPGSPEPNGAGEVAELASDETGGTGEAHGVRRHSVRSGISSARSGGAATQTPWQINALRLLLTVVLLGGGGGFGGWTYTDGRSAQQAEFLRSFDSSVDRLAVNVPATVELKRQAGIVISALFKYSTSYLNLPDFDQYYFTAEQMALVSGVKAVQFAPLITNVTRAHFEKWVLNASFLEPGAFPSPITESLAIDVGRGIWKFSAAGPIRVTEAERNASNDAEFPNLYMPIFYNAPMEGNLGIVLLDTASEVAKTGPAVLRAYKTMGTTTSELIYLGQDVVPRPSSIIYAPVLGLNDMLVGFTSVVFYWDSLFDSGLPTVLSGIDIVMRDFANSSYTFRLLDGGQLMPMGPGDIHDAGMESYKRTFKTILGVTFTFDVYPQQALQDAFYNGDPTNRLVVVMAIIALCSICFLLYDLIARRITSRLVARIDTANRVIDDVFPSHVKARLVHEITPTSNSDRRTGAGGISDQLIADFYPDATILICDVVSFTKWSASVTPSKVFSTLEIMFNWFDDIARRNGCFKGDAYVASCGCPVKSETHAVQMANMALDMMQVMDRVRQESGVLDLRVRIGINSGPITAGVIRAQNRRFQLFGDTINSASRMESTGSAGRIQCSEATARLLADTHVLEPRPGLVEAKGKGKLKTYWLIANRPDAEQAAAGRYFSSSGRTLVSTSGRRLSNGSIHSRGLCGLTLCLNMGQLRAQNLGPQVQTPASSVRPHVSRPGWPDSAVPPDPAFSFTADELARLAPSLMAGVSGLSGNYSQKSDTEAAAQWLAAALGHSTRGANRSHRSGVPLDDVLAYVRRLHSEVQGTTVVSACVSPSMSRSPTDPESLALQHAPGAREAEAAAELKEAEEAEIGEAASAAHNSRDPSAAGGQLDIVPAPPDAELPASAP